MKSACLTRRRLFRQGNEDTQTYSTTQSWLKTWSLILKTSEKLLRKIKDWHVQRTFRGSPLQFWGHDSIPACKTTSYDKTLDMWLCNTEATCMYATRLKLTTSHFLAFLIWKTEFDQTSLLILKVFENQRLSFKRLSTFFWAVLYQVAVVTLILCQILN